MVAPPTRAHKASVRHATTVTSQSLNRDPIQQMCISQGLPIPSPSGEVALQLVVLDHSINANDARAAGPCASSRAVAVAQIVMADAMAAAYPVDYEALYVRGRAATPDVPDAFVGGATAWILEYIFGTSAHSNFIANQKMKFLEPHEPAALRSCEAGLSFARNEAFTSLWNAAEICDAISSTPTHYV